MGRSKAKLNACIHFKTQAKLLRMKLPSLQELKRLGHAALKQGLDPSALERGLQYLRDGGFISLDIATLGAKGFVIEFDLKDSTQKTKIECTSVAQREFSQDAGLDSCPWKIVESRRSG